MTIDPFPEISPLSYNPTMTAQGNKVNIGELNVKRELADFFPNYYPKKAVPFGSKQSRFSSEVLP